jgi:DNA-binding response OmpR family regulator
VKAGGVSHTILIADDSLSIREAAEGALAARRGRVESVPDGGRALERLRETAPDLLIADVHMPGLDGYALCREAKSERPAMRVLLLVGTFEPFDSGAATAAGADGVVRKPFMADELLRQVESLLPRAAAPQPAREEARPEPAAAPPEAEPAAPAERSPGDATSGLALSDADVERIARRVLELGGEAVLERVARELLGEAAFERVRRSAAGAGEHARDPEL